MRSIQTNIKKIVLKNRRNIFQKNISIFYVIVFLYLDGQHCHLLEVNDNLSRLFRFMVSSSYLCLLSNTFSIRIGAKPSNCPILSKFWGNFFFLHLDFDLTKQTFSVLIYCVDFSLCIRH